MPEGDTVHKICNYLEPRLTGRPIESLMIHQVAAEHCTSSTIDRVSARGKHLFFYLDNGFAIRSHLGMHGSWHRYAPNEEWQKPRHRASLCLRVDAQDYVCFNAKEVEVLDAGSVRSVVVSSRLGPDLIADDISFDALVARSREIMRADDFVGDVLLDQRVASGIGNVYKSEVLFIEALSPWTTLQQIPDEALARCFDVAADRLGKNLGGGRRVTRFENDGAGRLWVYGRAGKPCLKCDTPVRNKRMGRHHRSTYWCPTCQPTPRQKREPK